MSNELVKHEHKDISAPAHFTPEQVDTIKNMFCKGLSDDEFKVYLYTCQRTGLDPFAKQIYAVKRGNAMTIQTGIDGYRLVADRSGKYAPGQEPVFVHDAHGKLLSATAFIKKRTNDGTWHNVPATAHFEEYVQSFNGKPAGLWLKMPRTMLAKCAEALAIRKAFPAELSGIYTKEEMEQADSVEVEVVSSKPIEFITSDQAEELRKIISECDPTKLDVMLEHVRKKCDGKDITHLPAKCFHKMRELFEDRRLQYLEQLMKEKMSGENEEVKDEG